MFHCLQLENWVVVSSLSRDLECSDNCLFDTLAKLLYLTLNVLVANPEFVKQKESLDYP